MKTLRAKFIFWICLLFILIGAFIFISLSIILPEKITAQILKRDIKIAQYLSREVQEPLLMNNKLTLKLLLKDRLENLQDAIYIFICGSDGTIVSSTFERGFPKGLLEINPIESKRELFKRNNPSENTHSIKKFLVDGKKVYDIAIPILGGELGGLHLGVSLESSKTEIAGFTKINYYVAGVIFVGLGVGVLIFTVLGMFLSNRIRKLKDFAQKIGRGDLDGRIDIKTEDEIGSLAASFNKMASDLKEKIEKIKRLSYLEERDRIALEFHDGLAQDLANIIMRLKLCEKLFKVEPSRAIEELETLRGNTRDILNRTRQMIFDLKTPKEADFKLLDNLTDYIKNYQKENNINIKLDIRGSLSNIPQDKAKSIFYIILEALTNIKKHSLAKDAQLILESNGNDRLNITIKDNGKGFNINEVSLNTQISGKWGLINMRQRVCSLGGVFSIDSKPNQGTEVSINIPLANEALKRL